MRDGKVALSATRELTTIQLARLTKRQARDMVVALCAGAGDRGPGAGPTSDPDP